MKRFFGLLFLLSVAIACKNDSDEDATPTPPTPDPPSGPTDVFKISADPKAFTADAMWFVAWDDDGTLLDYRKYAAGQTITLSTEEEITNNKVTFGYFRHVTNTEGFLSTYISVYTDLTPGTEIKFGPAQIARPSPGKFKLTVLNGPLNNSPSISNRSGLCEYKLTANVDKTLYEVNMVANDRKYIITYPDNPLLYHEINDVDPGDEFEIDYNDFKAYEKQTMVNLPSDYSVAIVYFRGIEADQDLTTGFNISPGYSFSSKMYISQPSVTLGYIPSTTQFLTTIHVEYKDGFVSYDKYGDLPGTLAWPNPSKYTVTSGDPNSFAVSVVDPVEYVTGIWSNPNDKRYFDELIINSPKLSPKIGAVPAEMITAHSRFEIKKERYPVTYFEFVTKGSQSYKDSFEAFIGKTTADLEKMSFVTKE